MINYALTVEVTFKETSTEVLKNGFKNLLCNEYPHILEGHENEEDFPDLVLLVLKLYNRREVIRDMCFDNGFFYLNAGFGEGQKYESHILKLFTALAKHLEDDSRMTILVGGGYMSTIIIKNGEAVVENTAEEDEDTITF